MGGSGVGAVVETHARCLSNLAKWTCELKDFTVAAKGSPTGQLMVVLAALSAWLMST
jgi:nitrate reductase NapAB chaperone NapD